MLKFHAWTLGLIWHDIWEQGFVKYYWIRMLRKWSSIDTSSKTLLFCSSFKCNSQGFLFKILVYAYWNTHLALSRRYFPLWAWECMAACSWNILDLQMQKCVNVQRLQLLTLNGPKGVPFSIIYVCNWPEGTVSPHYVMMLLKTSCIHNNGTPSLPEFLYMQFHIR
jgi:hypothetical protein